MHQLGGGPHVHLFQDAGPVRADGRQAEGKIPKLENWKALLAQGKILLRPCIELLFAIVAMYRHKNLYKEIIHQFDLEQERIFKNLEITDDPVLRAPFETPEAKKAPPPRRHLSR